MISLSSSGDYGSDFAESKPLYYLFSTVFDILGRGYEYNICYYTALFKSLQSLSYQRLVAYEHILLLGIRIHPLTASGSEYYCNILHYDPALSTDIFR